MRVWSYAIRCVTRMNVKSYQTTLAGTSENVVSSNVHIMVVKGLQYALSSMKSMRRHMVRWRNKKLRHLHLKC